MMLCGNRCAGGPRKPSGHAQFCCATGHTPPCNANIISENVPDGLPDDFSGPYKDFSPPGCREPAVGEQVRGDVPYLPSYLDPLNAAPTRASGATDNLYMRGPFFPGVSETHEQFVNRGGISPKKYYEFVRHYEEPGMKYDKSITQTDFVPPHPMLPKDKSPCLQEPPGEAQYVPKRPPPKNPHAKILEYKIAEPELIYVEEEPKREFSTETSDNYVCYQKPKTKKALKDVIPPQKELFVERLHGTHGNCPHGFPHEFMCDGKKCEAKSAWPDENFVCTAGKADMKPVCVRKREQDCERTPWLLFPRNYRFPNGYMILPSKCNECQCIDK
ncbi:hypothetical protein AVEN_242733-1 [Araneus ventricosus]|uniref:Uncharacterized protein n=1 Tax=Araneus ventricosus TaxID=182803 RepID=A0A4Y2RIN6_ARAVE|nr:hypothetical protein AVEN_11864-1 [Araneus ventricosus]GBN75322.1 hypothetical protein AVEN_242733-1 [Araneus ventricosus]